MDRETEFLNEQASIAKTRLRIDAAAMGNELKAPFRVAAMIRHKPGWSLGGAVAAGFLVAVGVRALARSPATQAAIRQLNEDVRQLSEPGSLRELALNIADVFGQGSAVGSALRSVFGARSAERPDSSRTDGHYRNGTRSYTVRS